ncbi:hypothetical protein JOC78_003231 [Bacillus ectoiniformans]|uniref:DUF4825 domain-containing protein n=1 Tax=Bacillus ectoiniformans TaxID=1494429 RepID=UPI00308452A0|nr:hypothetical protein [Bacillus ectoiniformans]
MRRRTLFIYIFSFAFLILTGCNSTAVNKSDDLFQYKDSYVGDSGAVGNITRRLPNPAGEHLNGLELKTKEEPYGVILNYIEADKIEDIELNYSELALYNATFIFALVKNADWVQFNFVEDQMLITREKLQDWYGKDIRLFSSEEELNRFVQEHLKDQDKVNQFFH